MTAPTSFNAFKVPPPVYPAVMKLKQEVRLLGRKIKALGDPVKWNPNTLEGKVKNDELLRLKNAKSAAEDWILEMDPKAWREHAKQFNFRSINPLKYKQKHLAISDKGWPIFEDIVQKIPRLKAVKKLIGKRPLSALLKVKSDRVHAVALPSGSGPVVEDMPQVGPAAAADGLGPLRKKRTVDASLDGTSMNGPGEAGPSGS